MKNVTERVQNKLLMFKRILINLKRNVGQSAYIPELIKNVEKIIKKLEKINK